MFINSSFVIHFLRSAVTTTVVEAATAKEKIPTLRVVFILRVNKHFAASFFKLSLFSYSKRVLMTSNGKERENARCVKEAGAEREREKY